MSLLGTWWPFQDDFFPNFLCIIVCFSPLICEQLKDLTVPRPKSANFHVEVCFTDFLRWWALPLTQSPSNLLLRKLHTCGLLRCQTVLTFPTMHVVWLLHLSINFLLFLIDNYLDIAWSTDRIWGNFCNMIIPSVPMQNRSKPTIFPTMIFCLFTCCNFLFIVFFFMLRMVNQLEFLSCDLWRIMLLQMVIIELVEEVQLILHRLFLSVSCPTAIFKLWLEVSTAASIASRWHLNLWYSFTDRATAVIVDIGWATAEDCLRYLS